MEQRTATELQKFSDSLAIKSDQENYFNSTINFIYKLLQTKSRNKVDRLKIGGSFGKKTAVYFNVDIDMVVYVNNLDFDSKVDDILSDWKDILRMNTDINDITRKRGLSFRYKGVDFDLLVAPNLSQSAKEQILEITRYILYNPDLAKSTKYTVAATEAALEFVKTKSPFVHSLCRLAKLWQKSICYFTYVPGRSLIFECLAIYAGMEQEQSSCDMYSGFLRFLELVRDLKNKVIHFPDYYEEYELPPPSCKPAVCVPFNPYQNLLDARNVDDTFYSVFKQCAENTISKLKTSKFSTFELFYPQPTIFECLNKSANILRNSQKFVCGISDQESLQQPSVECRLDGAQNSETETANFCKLMLTLLAGLLASHLDEQLQPTATEKNALDVLTAYVDTSIRNVKLAWTPCEVNDKFDFIFKIPLRRFSNKIIFLAINF